MRNHPRGIPRKADWRPPLTKAEAPSMFGRFGNSSRFCYGFAFVRSANPCSQLRCGTFSSPQRFAAHGPVR
jgi:hypothetical protein